MLYFTQSTKFKIIGNAKINHDVAIFFNKATKKCVKKKIFILAGSFKWDAQFLL